jgi:Lar family restriction alleviation protein
MENRELKPCPFCGGKPFVSNRFPLFGEEATVAIVCEECNASTQRKRTERKAINDWNRRAENGIHDICK